MCSLLIALAALGPLSSGEGSALTFSGGQVLSTPSFPLGEHTVELWVRPEGPLPPLGSGLAILDWGGHVRLSLSRVGLLYTVRFGDGGEAGLVTRVLPSGEWHHVAVAFDGESMVILVDGVLANQRFITGTVGGDEGEVFLGAALSGASRDGPFTGQLDDLRIWDHARTEYQVEELKDDHLGAAAQPGLIAYWDMDEGSGDSALDRRGGLEAVLGEVPVPDPLDPEWTAPGAPLRKPDPGFSLGFNPAGPLVQGAGEAFQVACVLESLGAAGGVTGWTIAVRHDRRSVILENVILQSTAADERLADGFVRLEYHDDGVRAGFTSQVLLSATGNKTLPPLGRATLAYARYRGLVSSSAPATAAIRYDDRLPAGSGGPWENAVSAGGARQLPSEARLDLTSTPPVFHLGTLPRSVTVTPEREVEVQFTLTTSGNRAANGPSSWSIAVGHDPEVLELVSYTLDGTVLDDFAGESVLILNERTSAGPAPGFISVVILNLARALALPANGTAVVARARYRLRPEAELNQTTQVSFLDGLQGSGVPVDNLIGFIGGSAPPAEKVSLDVQVARTLFFLRSDSNGDTQTNLSDAVYTLNALFVGGSPLSCADAADSNDDGLINIADPIHCLSFLFTGGPLPREPFPSMGEDPTGDSLECEEYPSPP